MATSYYKLDIETRESVGKKSTKAIRRDGKIPSTLYFKGDEPESIAIDKIKLYQALKSDQRVYEVELGGESQYVMVKAVQYHPVVEGGILSQALNQIEISCFPTNVPDQIEVNIDKMELNSSISVADVSTDDEEVEILSSSEINVATITAPSVEVEDTVSDDDNVTDEDKDDLSEDQKSDDSDNEEESKD